MSPFRILDGALNNYDNTSNNTTLYFIVEIGYASTYGYVKPEKNVLKTRCEKKERKREKFMYASFHLNQKFPLYFPKRQKQISTFFEIDRRIGK